MKHPSVVFYFAYALSLKDVIQEIEQIGTTMKLLFGEDEHLQGVFDEDAEKIQTEITSPSNFRSLLTYTFTQ